MMTSRPGFFALVLSALLVPVTLLGADVWSILWVNPGAIKHVDDSAGHRRSLQRLVHQRNQRRLAATGAARASG